MILINLLPHRQAAREMEKKQFSIQILLSILLATMVTGFGYFWLNQKILEQQERNQFLIVQTAILDNEIKDVSGLKAQIASLRARQSAVENLQTDRNMPAHLLGEIVSRMPDGVYLRSLKQENATVMLSGIAQSQERVSALLRNMLTQQEFWLGQPELVEIVSSTTAVSSAEQQKVSNFTVRIGLKRPAVSRTDENAAEISAKASVETIVK